MKMRVGTLLTFGSAGYQTKTGGHSYTRHLTLMSIEDGKRSNRA